jgi:hypothetical protein
MRSRISPSAAQSLNERWPNKVSLRLKDGTIKRWVEVNGNGEAVAERYEEYASTAEYFGPPRFTTDQIESWGTQRRAWHYSGLRPLAHSGELKR